MTDRLSRTPIRRRTLLASGGGLALMALNGPLAGAGVRDSRHVGKPRQELDLPRWDTRSDTWSATDALGRTLPMHEEVGPPRDDRFVGMFYFLWMGEHSNSGPYNVSHILAEHPEAANDKEHPAWGPLGDYHWWEESQYGYYLSSDQWVVRRHARMLVDAGIDVIIFDVTNNFDYRDNYMELLDTFAQIRAEGGQTPGVAFLCPWNAAQPLVKKLYQDMYAEGIHEDLWFRWKGKPLVLSNPELLGPELISPAGADPSNLKDGETQGQKFTVGSTATWVGARVPTWSTADSGCTLTIRRDGPAGEVIASQVFENIQDNSVCTITPDSPLESGTYYLEQSEPIGEIGWWSDPTTTWDGGKAFHNGVEVAGVRETYLEGGDTLTGEVLDFFTFRAARADYFLPQDAPGQWSWLQDHPQNVFVNEDGTPEQIAVSTAQNAVGGRLGAMSEPAAQGRSFHNDTVPTDSSHIREGLNFQEQWDTALKIDPEFVFITGWNEWVAMRFEEWSEAEGDVIFVDQFDTEHSRDIEPAKGELGDDYYYQLVANVRRFKGVRPLEKASEPVTISPGGRSLRAWNEVGPTFLDHQSETAPRNHPGWGNVGIYTNTTGRNEILSSKVARDSRNVAFYVETAQDLTPHTDPNWMLLLLEIVDRDAPAWEGFHFVANRQFGRPGHSLLEASTGGWNWRTVDEVRFMVSGRKLQLVVPRTSLGLAKESALDIRFKWIDNWQEPGSMIDLLSSGDTAPSGRFSYRYRT